MTDGNKPNSNALPAVCLYVVDAPRLLIICLMVNSEYVMIAGVKSPLIGKEVDVDMEKILKETTLRIGVLTRVLQRAEYIDEDEKIISLEFDEGTNIITLNLEEANND